MACCTAEPARCSGTRLQGVQRRTSQRRNHLRWLSPPPTRVQALVDERSSVACRPHPASLAATRMASQRHTRRCLQSRVANDQVLQIIGRGLPVGRTRCPFSVRQQETSESTDSQDLGRQIALTAPCRGRPLSPAFEAGISVVGCARTHAARRYVSRSRENDVESRFTQVNANSLAHRNHLRGRLYSQDSARADVVVAGCLRPFPHSWRSPG